MAFKPGISGNPAGRPKKLLRRMDEVLFARGIDPMEEICTTLEALKRTRGKGKELAAAKRLSILMELLPYVYPRVKEVPDDGGDELAKKPTGELLKLVKEKYPELRGSKG